MTDEQLEKLIKQLEKLTNGLRWNSYLLAAIMMFVAGITILCLQDAPLLSVNSIVPALMVVWGLRVNS